MGRALPGVERERHRNCNGWRQLLRLSAAAVFILPLVKRVARMRAHAPIVAEVRCMLQLQKVARRKGRRRLQPVRWHRLGIFPVVNASIICVSTEVFCTPVLFGD